jgi:hypothetical protein
MAPIITIATTAARRVGAAKMASGSMGALGPHKEDTEQHREQTHRNWMGARSRVCRRPAIGRLAGQRSTACHPGLRG